MIHRDLSIPQTINKPRLIVRPIPPLAQKQAMIDTNRIRIFRFSLNLWELFQIRNKEYNIYLNSV